MKIALLQLLPTGTLEGQLEKGLEACRRAKAMGRILPCFRRCGVADMRFQRTWGGCGTLR